MPDLFHEFLAAPFLRRVELASDPAHQAELRARLGADQFAAYQRLAGGLDPAHLAAGSPPNLVFVPGIMGSVLRSEGLGGIWWLDVRTRNHLNDLALNADGTGDLDAGHKISSCAVDPAYEGFFAAALATEDFGHVGCHYDWRKPFAASTHRLVDDIQSARRRNGGNPVHVVAHSMGGLLVRETLRRHPALWNDLGRIVFIGTPHYGSPAIAWYLKNHLNGFQLMAVLGQYLSRETFRSLWGVLCLLPAPRGTYPGTHENDPDPFTTPDDGPVHPCANFNLYDAEDWKLDLTPTQLARLQAGLDAAARFHRDLYAWHMGLDQLQRDRMAVIAGIGYKTLFRISYERRLGFLWKHMRKVSSRAEGDRHRDGDGRVPRASAELEFVGETRYVRGEHGALPSLPAVYRDVFRFLREEEMELADSPAGALDGHLAASDLVSEVRALDRSAPAAVANDDPGYLDFDDPDPQAVEELKTRVEAETVPTFQRLRIL